MTVLGAVGFGVCAASVDLPNALGGVAWAGGFGDVVAPVGDALGGVAAIGAFCTGGPFALGGFDSPGGGRGLGNEPANGVRHFVGTAWGGRRKYRFG